MTGSFWVDNLAVYSLQILIVVSVGALLALIVPLRTPRARLIYWRSLLAVCLLLPVLQVWEAVPLVEVVQVRYGPGQASEGTAAMQPAPLGWDMSGWIWPVLLAGVALRLTWLSLGLLRLRRYRLESRLLDPLPADIAKLREQLGVNCELRLSEHPRGPVMFGLRRPVILLPERFLELDAEVQTSIAFHELLHVKRLDWGFTFSEELLRAVLWFHPAVWWLINRIQLSREQAVDREVLVRTGKRESYIAALLAMSGADTQLDLAPAPLFLRGRHLDMRIASILEEVTMSSKALLFRISLITAAVTATTWVTVGHFPLRAAPEPQVAEGDRPIAIEQGGEHLLHRAAITYPQVAVEKGVEGYVVIEVSIDTEGSVYDARVISGPDELRAGALRSVLEWHYSDVVERPSTMLVTIRFTLPDKRRFSPNGESFPPEVRGEIFETEAKNLGALARVEVRGLPDDRRDLLLARLPVKVGDIFYSNQLESVRRAVREFDEHLRITLNSPPTADGGREVTIRIFLPDGQMAPGAQEAGVAPKRIRVGGALQAARLEHSLPPDYPALAKQAGVEGLVLLEAVIGQDGAIQNLDVTQGPALLVPAAIAAVKAWRYKPTLLNGEAVEVVTEIAVDFRLP